MGEMLRKDQKERLEHLGVFSLENGSRDTNFDKGKFFSPFQGVKFSSWRGWLLECKGVVHGSRPQATGLRLFQLVRTLLRKSFPENLRLGRQVGQGQAIRRRSKLCAIHNKATYFQVTFEESFSATQRLLLVVRTCRVCSPAL